MRNNSNGPMGWVRYHDNYETGRAKSGCQSKEATA